MTHLSTLHPGLDKLYLSSENNHVILILKYCIYLLGAPGSLVGSWSLYYISPVSDDVWGRKPDRSWCFSLRKNVTVTKTICFLVY
jgi:hypothetical protein